MRSLAKVLLFIVIAFCYGCNSDKAEETTFLRNSITIINFGGADSAYNKIDTRGFGINNYTFIDLNTDSVFVRQKYEMEEPIQVKMKSGILKNLGKNDTILEGLAALRELPNGFIKGSETDTEQIFFYSGPHAYLEHQIGNEKKYYFYTHHELDSTIENMSRLLLSLGRKQGLKELDSTITFDEDKILMPVLNLNGMENFNPPPIKVKTIKFIPPVKGYKKDSTQNP